MRVRMPLQREWTKQFRETDKVLGWPSHTFESFIIVVRFSAPVRRQRRPRTAPPVSGGPRTEVPYVEGRSGAWGCSLYHPNSGCRMWCSAATGLLKWQVCACAGAAANHRHQERCCGAGYCPQRCVCLVPAMQQQRRHPAQPAVCLLCTWWAHAGSALRRTLQAVLSFDIALAVLLCSAVKSGDLNVAVTPETVGQVRHRGSRGTPLPPQVTQRNAFVGAQ